MPSDVVAMMSYPPDALPTKSLPYVGVVEVPVPPFPTGSVPVTCVESESKPERVENDRHVLLIA